MAQATLEHFVGLARAWRQSGVGTPCLGKQRRKIGHVVVPFDQGRDRAGAGQCVVVERENIIQDRTCVRVDQQPVADAVHGLVITGQMDLADKFDGEAVDIGIGSRP